MGETISNDYIKDCLSTNPFYEDDMGTNKGSLLKANLNFEPWGDDVQGDKDSGYKPWESISAYNELSISNGESEGEPLEEVIKRVVKEAIGQITEEGVLITPEIEKYHIKHK